MKSPAPKNDPPAQSPAEEDLDPYDLDEYYQQMEDLGEMERGWGCLMVACFIGAFWLLVGVSVQYLRHR